MFGQRIAADGSTIGDNVQLSPVGTQGEYPSAAIAGGRLGFGFTSFDGVVVRLMFATAAPDLSSVNEPLVMDPTDACAPEVVALGDSFAMTWAICTDSGPGSEIFGALFDTQGKLSFGPVQVLSGSAHVRSQATLSLGDRLVLAWADDSQQNYELWFETLDEKLTSSARQRITTTSSETLDPILAPANDGSIGVLFEDRVSGTRQAYFTSLICQGMAPSPPTP